MKHADPGSGTRSQRLLALCGAGSLVFNFPLLTLWKGDLFGLPLLPVALFGLWVGLILLLALISDGRSSGPDRPPP